jgi:class 3 adenylate cyclase/TolB-like protein
VDKERRKLTVRQAAGRLGVGASTVTRWCKQQKLPNAIKVETPRGPVWSIPETDLKEIKDGISRNQPAKASTVGKKSASKNSLVKWAGASRITLALVFTDVVKSTVLINELGDKKWKPVRKRHFAKARKLINHWNGHEVKTMGDSFMAVFHTADEAFEFAKALRTDTGDELIKIRASIHVGAVRVEEGDVHGGMVNLTKRIIEWLKEDRIALSDFAKMMIDAEWGAQYSLSRFVQVRTGLKSFDEPQTLWLVWEFDEIKKVAVLPFLPVGSVRRDDKDKGRMMADTISSNLNKVGRIIVRPASSSKEYIGQRRDAAAAGHKLKVDLVVDGRFQRTGNKIHVIVQYVRVCDRSLLWEETYDEVMDRYEQ